MNQTDAQLLLQAKIESTLQPPTTGAFEAILEKYQRLVYYIAYRFFSNGEDALDISQEVALKIYNGLTHVTLAEDGSLKPWISTITTRTCIDLSRKSAWKNKNQTLEWSEDLAQQLPHTPSAEHIYAAQEEKEDLQAAIGQLNTDARMAIILRDIEGLSYEEMAQVLGINMGTVKSRISRARLALKKILTSAR